MGFLYNFGLSQEDERTEATALGLPGGHILCIASAGDMPISLLALGADRVTAVDVDPNQVHLARLKVASILSLEREDAIHFLGFMPATKARRREWLEKVLHALPSESCRFWKINDDTALRGAVWGGRYERFASRLSAAVRPLTINGIRALIAASGPEEQRAVFDRHFDRRVLRAIFRLAFHPRIFSSRGMDPQSLEYHDRRQSLGEQYFNGFRDLCTATPARTNYLLQMHLLGRVVSYDAVPAYLSVEGYPTVRSRTTDLKVVEADIIEWLRSIDTATFDGVHLSNVPDWFSQSCFEDLLRLVSEKAKRPSRVVWRFLHVDRSIPDSLAGKLRVNRAWGDVLRGDDRFPFYSIVPGEFRTAATDGAASARVAPTLTLSELPRSREPDLHEINRSCPIKADFTFYFDRSPDFFRWPDVVFGDHRYVGTFRGDRLVGYAMVGWRRGWTGTDWGWIHYGGDARILPEHRGQRMAGEAAAWLARRVPDDATVGLMLVKRGNQAAARVVDRLEVDGFRHRHLCAYEVINIPLLYRISPAGVCHVRPAGADDRTAVVDLFARTYDGRLFAPRITEDQFAPSWPPAGAGRITWYVAERAGRVAGALGLWDMDDMRRTRVLHYSPRVRIVRNLVRAGRLVFRNAARLPQPGGSLRCLHAAYVAVEDDEPAVLRDLLAHAVRDHIGRGYHLMHIGFCEGDALRHATATLFVQRFRSEVVLSYRSDRLHRRLKLTKPPYIDLSMV